MRNFLVIALALVACNAEMDDPSEAMDDAAQTVERLAPNDLFAADVVAPDGSVELRGELACDEGSYEMLVSIFPNEAGYWGLIELMESKEQFEVEGGVMDGVMMLAKKDAPDPYHRPYDAGNAGSLAPAPGALDASDPNDLVGRMEGTISQDGRSVEGLMDDCEFVIDAEPM